MLTEKIIDSFKFLIKDYNYSVEEIEDDSVMFKSTKCKVQVYLDRGPTVELRVIGLGEIPGIKAGMSKEFNLEEILYFTNPELRFRYVINARNLEAEIDKIANYFFVYCKPIIEGDLSIWVDLNKQREQLWKEMEGDDPKIFGESVFKKNKRRLP